MSSKTYTWDDDSSETEERPRPGIRRDVQDQLIRGGDCLELIFPGVDDPDDAIEDVVLSTEAIEAINAKSVGMTKLEILVTPGEDHLKYFLVPYGSGLPSKNVRKGNHTVQKTLEQMGEESTSDSADSNSKHQDTEHDDSETSTRLLATVKNAFEATKEFPDSFGFKETKLDFSGLGCSVPVCRLLTQDNPDYTDLKNFDYNPQAALFETLLADGIPFIYQVIIGFDSSKKYDYTISVRLAVFEPDSAIATQRELKKQIDNTHKYDLNDYYQQPNLSTNYSFSTEQYFATNRETAATSLTPREFVNPRVVNDALKITKATGEFEQLLHATHNNRSIYKTFDLNSRMPVKKNMIPGFVGIYYQPYSYSPWDSLSEHNAPRSIGGKVLKSAHGTEITDDLPVIKQPTSSRQAGNRGKDEHEQLVEKVYERLKSAGYEVWIIEQTGDSVPDIRATKNGETFAIEICSKGHTKAANVLGNVLRGEYNDEKVLFYTDTKQVARKISKQIEYPFNTKNADKYNKLNKEGLWAYTSKSLTTIDDETILLPGGNAKAQWRLCHDGTGELWHDGTIVASGDLSNSATTFEYDLPRLDQSGNQQRVIDADGNEIETYETKEAFQAEWTKLYAPLVPTKRTYSPAVEIYHFEDDDPALYTHRPNWDKSGKTMRYEKSNKHFFAHFTKEVQGEELYRDSVREYYFDWFGSLTNRKAPNNRYFGVSTAEAIKTKARDDEDGNQITLYKNRTWVFPEGIVSPDLPFISGGASVPEY